MERRANWILFCTHVDKLDTAIEVLQRSAQLLGRFNRGAIGSRCSPPYFYAGRSRRSAYRDPIRWYLSHELWVLERDLQPTDDGKLLCACVGRRGDSGSRTCGVDTDMFVPPLPAGRRGQCNDRNRISQTDHKGASQTPLAISTDGETVRWSGKIVGRLRVLDHGIVANWPILAVL